MYLWYKTGQICEQAPDKFPTSSGQVLDKFRFKTCPRVVQKSNLSASCPRLHRNFWILYWKSSSCPKTELLVRELSAVGQLSDKFLSNGQVSSYHFRVHAQQCCASYTTTHNHRHHPTLSPLRLRESLSSVLLCNVTTYRKCLH
jgi:hypothetical protein